MFIPVINLPELIDSYLYRREASKVKERVRTHSETRDPRVTEASVVVDGQVYGACLRKVFYRMKYEVEPAPATPYSVRVMDIGSHIEKVDHEALSEMGVLVKENDQFNHPNPLKPEQNIRGEIDTLIKIPSDDEIIQFTDTEIDVNVDKDYYVIVEHKTGHGYQFERNTFGTKTKKGSPRVSYVLQLAIYLDLYPRVNDIQVPYGILYYRDRGTQAAKQYTVMLVGPDRLVYIAEHPSRHVDQSFTPTFEPFMGIKMDDVYSRYAQLYDYLERNELPPRDYDPMWDAAKVIEKHRNGEISDYAYKQYKRGKVGVMRDVECKYCPFLKQCLKDD